MPLNSFGAILTFAETLESRDAAFYGGLAAAGTPYEGFAGEGRKHIQILQRTRRENVTEMILEPIQDFTREPYDTDPGDPSALSPEEARAAAAALETRAAEFYRAAAEKIAALPEVARALRQLAKKRQVRLARLSAFG